MNKEILILINDADPVFARVVRAKLEHDFNWSITITSSYDEVLKKAKADNPSLLVTDLILSDSKGRTGYDLITELKEDGDFEGKIVVLTELAQDIDKDKAEKQGVEYYFVKSETSIKDFAHIIKDLLPN